MTNDLFSDFDLNDPDLVEVIDDLPLWSAPFGLELLKKITYKQNIAAIDIGCGAGFPLTEIAMRLGSASTIYGIDPWKGALERIKKKLLFYGIHNVNLIEGYAENIPLEESTVDLIVSNNGINNVTDLHKTMQECYRVAKSGAQMVLSVNTNKTFIEFYEIFEDTLLEQNMINELESMLQHIYEKRKPEKEIIQHIRGTGFSNVNVDHHQFKYTFVDGTSFLNYILVKIAFLQSWKDIIPEEKQGKIFSILEYKMNEKARKLGHFELSVPYLIIDAYKSEK